MTNANPVSVRTKIGLVALVIACSAGCTASRHGSFAANSHMGIPAASPKAGLGPTQGTSCQTRALYLFPIGKEVSTSEAIASAMSKHEGTQYITNVSIDDRTRWGFGYSEQCITVDATAY